MNRSSRRWSRRLPGAVVIGLVAAVLAALPAGADSSPSGPTEKQRTLPHLKFVCPAMIGDYRWDGLIPDGPAMEHCFYEDKTYARLAVGAEWHQAPNTPGDPYAVCVGAERTVWHEEDSTHARFTRISATRRARGYVTLNLYWPNPEKLARMKAMLPQLEALGDQMRAAAEKLAQPCVQPTPTETTTSSESTSDDPSESSSTSTPPTPTATSEKGELCRAIDGRLTDNSGRPVTNVVVRLYVNGEHEERATDGEGRFHFSEIPDEPASYDHDAGVLAVLARDGDGSWRLHARDSEAGLVTEPFALTDAEGCRHDLTTSSLDGYAAANPDTPQQWADLWMIATQSRRALQYIDTTLRVDLRDLPIEIRAWCPPSLSARKCAAGSMDAFAGERSPTTRDRAEKVGITGRVPYIALGGGMSDQAAETPMDDTIYHEFGHLLQAELAGGFDRLVRPGQTNHAGYVNPSSNDSWIEGFASWFAISLRQADGRQKPFYVWGNPLSGNSSSGNPLPQDPPASSVPRDVERDVKAWEANGRDEEWAVVSLLNDLTDRGTTVNNGQGQPLPFTTSAVGQLQLIEGTAAGATPGRDSVVVELFDAGGSRVASDDALVLPNGAFLDLPMVPFSRARVFLRTPQDGTGRRDDEKFTLSAREVIRLIKNPPNIGVRGRRTGGSWVVFDVDELHSVLRARLGREREVDALFVAHGFHENLKNQNRYVGGDIGMTTHPPFTRERPRHGVRILPAQYVTVDTGGTRATVAVFPKDGMAYLATPDEAHRVPVLIAGSTDSRAAMVILADGHHPAVTTIEGGTFWAEAAEHDGSFLTIRPELQPIPEPDSGDDVSGRLGWLLVIGAGVALITLAAGAVLIIVFLRRRRTRRQVAGEGAWPGYGPPGYGPPPQAAPGYLPPPQRTPGYGPPYGAPGSVPQPPAPVSAPGSTGNWPPPAPGGWPPPPSGHPTNGQSN